MIDLHIHSTASDGILTPEKILSTSKQKELKAISITDHDCVSGAQQVIRTKIIELVPGIEISTDYQEQEMHILGYYIDLGDEELNKSLEWLRQKRLERIDKMLEKLHELEIDVKREEILLGDMEAVGRMHVAKILVDKGIVNDYKEAFDEYLKHGGKIFVPRKKLGYSESINIIKNTGGVPILAHPGEIRTDNVLPFLNHALNKGIQGIEILHPSNNNDMRKTLFDYCEEHDLLITGGSDYHGRGTKDVGIGGEKIPYEYLEKIKQFLNL